jgi:hypothetical protein
LALANVGKKMLDYDGRRMVDGALGVLGGKSGEFAGFCPPCPTVKSLSVQTTAAGLLYRLSPAAGRNFCRTSLLARDANTAAMRAERWVDSLRAPLLTTRLEQSSFGLTDDDIGKSELFRDVRSCLHPLMARDIQSKRLFHASREVVLPKSTHFADGVGQAKHCESLVETCDFDEQCGLGVLIDLLSEVQVEQGARQRLAYALCESALDRVPLDTMVPTVALDHLVAADQALVTGRMADAVDAFDGLRTELPLPVCEVLEQSLAVQLQRTPVSFFRTPMASLPNGEMVPPDSYRGGYHGSGSVQPEQALTVGLAVRGPNLSLQDHVLEAGGTAFRGATPMVSDPDGLAGAALWASEGGWVYDIRHVPTWNANMQLQGRCEKEVGYADNLLSGELELVIPGYIPPEKIRRYGQVEVLHGIACVRHWHDNPKFRE